jgi:hypothetical protein
MIEQENYRENSNIYFELLSNFWCVFTFNFSLLKLNLKSYLLLINGNEAFGWVKIKGIESNYQ